MATADSETLTWSTQLNVAPALRTPKLLGDKITLPPSALEALLAAAPVVSLQNERSRAFTSTFDPFNPHTYAAERHAREQLSDRQQQLPHPLTFRIVNPQNGRVTHAGIREFSAADNEIGLSRFLQEALGLEDASTPPNGGIDASLNSSTEAAESRIEKLQNVTIHAKQLPKGTYVRLRPLEAGYDPEDWKSLLERYLRDNFTTLTNGELLIVPGGRHEHFRFLVDQLKPEGDGICIVDTDLEVDIEALNEEQARETLNKKLAKSQNSPGDSNGSSVGGVISPESNVHGQVQVGEYVDYELKEWDRTKELAIELATQDDVAELDLLVSPFSNRQRSRPRDDEYVFGDFSSRASKRIKLSPSNVELEDAESVFISVHRYRSENPLADVLIPYSLQVSSAATSLDESIEITLEAGPDEVTCKNCRQQVPKRTLPLHEAFCYRNNVFCPHCSIVFLKHSLAWKNHWHCSHGDGASGNTPASHQKHDEIFHPANAIQCPNCEFEAANLPYLARHRTSTCPGKEILCQFCHLIVPQQGPDDPSFTDPEVLLSGLTPHELADGARTTECHLCNKIVRLRDMKMHLKLHDRERISKPKPKLCRNANCGRTIPERDRMTSDTQQMGLCSDCFAPLYVANYDPEGKALRRRVERRLLQQLMAGCGRPWCRNTEFCRTAQRNHGPAGSTPEAVAMTAKEAFPRLKPVMDAIAANGTAPLYFCVEEASQQRRLLAQMMAEAGEYELEWCVKALEESPHNDLARAGEWLGARAPRIGEMIR